MKAKLLPLFFLSCLLLGGCKHKVVEPKHNLWFTVESTPMLPPALIRTVSLPESHMLITVSSKPLFPPSAITDVDLVEVKLGYCLKFRVEESVAIPLYQNSMLNLGKRLVLMSGHQAIGFVKLGSPIMNGEIYIFVEMDETQMRALVREVKSLLSKDN